MPDGLTWREAEAEIRRQYGDRTLSARALGALRGALADGDIPDAAPATIAGQGRQWWLRTPNVGKRTLDEIGALIGGWNSEAEERIAELERREQERKRAADEAVLASRREWRLERRRRLARMAAARASGGVEERGETLAQAFACLADALIEMRPHVHPSHFEAQSDA